MYKLGHLDLQIMYEWILLSHFSSTGTLYESNIIASEVMTLIPSQCEVYLMQIVFM